MKGDEEIKKDCSKFLVAAYPNGGSVQKDGKVGGSVVKSRLEGVRRIEMRREDHTMRNTLLVVFTVIGILLCLDLRLAIGHERHKLQLQAAQCHKEFEINQCEKAVEVMKARCLQLQQCFRLGVEGKIRVSSILGNLLGSMVSSYTSSAGLLGSIFLLILIALIFYFAYHSSKTQLILHKDN